MATRKLALALLVPIVSSLLVAGCGSSDDGDKGSSGAEVTTTAPTTDPDEPVAGDDGGGSDPGAGSGTTVPGNTDGSDDPDAPIAVEDAQTLIGLTQEEAELKAEDFGWTLRVVRLDGEDLAATNDYLPSRVNVEVTDGDVTDVVSIG